MKKRFLTLSVLFTLCLFGVRSAVEAEEPPPFKMIIRLWPHHHTDTVLRDQLLGALKRQRAAADEVWFCTELGLPRLEKHQQSAYQLKEAARLFRKEGIGVSLQIGATIGHGDGFMGDFSALRWQTLVGADGQVALQGSCPRQNAFLDYLACEAAYYAEAIQPEIVWIDDDLRVALHHPVRDLCFCDTCLDLFSREQKRRWHRDELVAALDKNEGEGGLRNAWIAFGQESLAGVARAIARSVHRVSPHTRMGLQHYNGHRDLTNGYDWTPVFDAMQQETGMLPASRPGNGFYQDHAPRGMIEKGFDMAVQVARLPSADYQIAAEVEAFQHRSTGKSGHGLAVESFLYLAMGCNQLSYAILCSAFEPMEWYEENFLEPLARWRPFYQQYADLNRDTRLWGVLPYTSLRQSERPLAEGENSFGWSRSKAGRFAPLLAPLGIPFSPGTIDRSCVKMIDPESLKEIQREELSGIIGRGGVVFDRKCIDRLRTSGLMDRFVCRDTLQQYARRYEDGDGKRIGFVSFDPEISHKERLEMIGLIDWASGNQLPVWVESAAQLMVLPHVDKNNRLRSIGVVNVSIGDQRPVLLRFRSEEKLSSVRWHVPEEESKSCTVEEHDGQYRVLLPPMKAWSVGVIELPVLVPE